MSETIKTKHSAQLVAHKKHGLNVSVYELAKGPKLPIHSINESHSVLSRVKYESSSAFPFVTQNVLEPSLDYKITFPQARCA